MRAAGVEMWMSVTVANYGDAPARGVTVQLEQDGDALPALALDDIPPRDEVTHKFRVQFAGIGAHSLTASLGADAVDVDNRRYFACDLPAARPVLIIDGSQDGRGGRQLSLALAPGGNTRTGWQPHVEPASFLADAERLERTGGRVPARCAATGRRRAGRAGRRTSATAAASRSSSGRTPTAASTTTGFIATARACFPRRSSCRRSSWIAAAKTTPDVEVTEHPLFHVLAGRRNGFLPLVMIDYYYALADDWTPPNDGAVQVIARLRNNEPLVVEKQFGKGRVVAQLTKLSSGDTPLGRWTQLEPESGVSRAGQRAGELPGGGAAGRSAASMWATTWSSPSKKAKYEPTFRFSLPGDGVRRRHRARGAGRCHADRRPAHGASWKTSRRAASTKRSCSRSQGEFGRAAICRQCADRRRRPGPRPSRRPHAATGRRRLPTARRRRHGARLRSNWPASK